MSIFFLGLPLSFLAFSHLRRAENSSGTIHMSEFYMIEAEECFVDSIDDITRRIESTIKTVTKNLLDKHAKEIHKVYEKYAQYADRDTIDSERFGWLEKPFKTITYAEAADILQEQPNFDQKSGLSKSDELYLVEHLQAPVFVIDWPRELKPFYMRTCKYDAKLVSFQHDYSASGFVYFIVVVFSFCRWKLLISLCQWLVNWLEAAYAKTIMTF